MHRSDCQPGVAGDALEAYRRRLATAKGDLSHNSHLPAGVIVEREKKTALISMSSKCNISLFDLATACYLSVVISSFVFKVLPRPSSFVVLPPTLLPGWLTAVMCLTCVLLSLPLHVC